MTQATVWSHQMKLPAEEHSVRTARDFVYALLTDHGFLDLVDVVRLAVSELTTNAVRHAHTPFTVTLERNGEALLLTVTDGSPSPVDQRAPDLLRPGGRGLALVDTVSHDWGVIQRPEEGKTVWASFALPAPA
jgi:anti-sigma regulatory factor (Ser/Thr protein kinase)